MILLIPHNGEIQPVDLRLIRLANLLGIECRRVQLPKTTGDWPESLADKIPHEDSCFVINPRVLQKWLGTGTLPVSLASFLIRHFRALLVHAVDSETFDSSVIRELSYGTLQSIQEIECGDRPYDISSDSKDVCDVFSGLSFGPVNVTNDRVFVRGRNKVGTRSLISVAGHPFMAVHEQEKCKTWFVASEEVADLDTKVGDSPLCEYFSRLVPHAMALRSIFGEESWRPRKHYASVVIDDPLLRPNYGALNFESLLALMKQHDFHSTVAFIPRNFKRNSSRTIRLLRENRGHFALCFHGNDHTGAEFASTDTELLNTLLWIARQRMERHRKLTGLDCDRVMVFPQGRFSTEAMATLKSHDFDGAVNTTPHPMHESNSLTLAEIAQPAVLRYSNFPLFLRKKSLNTESADIAFNAFFGKPILIVEHQDVFQQPEVLVDTVNRINKIVPNICWSSLGTILRNTILWKRTADGINHIRAYSRTVEVSSDSLLATRYSVEWQQTPQPTASVGKVLLDGGTELDFVSDQDQIQVSVDLPPGCSRTISLVQNVTPGKMRSLGLRYNAKVFLRRRLSEVRDNYLSKNSRILATAKAVQQRLVRTA